MKITNLSFEFLIEHGLKYKLATRKLNYFRLDTRNLDRYSIANGIRYISNSGTNKELVMIGTERNNETTIKGIYNLRKLTYFIYKRECLIGILESFTYCVSENRFDIIHFFVKKMDCEEISLTLEFLLPLNLDSQILGIRDDILQYISSKPSARFQRDYS